MGSTPTNSCWPPILFYNCGISAPSPSLGRKLCGTVELWNRILILTRDIDLFAYDYSIQTFVRTNNTWRVFHSPWDCFFFSWSSEMQALVKLRVCPECAFKLNYKKEKQFRKAQVSAWPGMFKPNMLVQCGFCPSC